MSGTYRPVPGEFCRPQIAKGKAWSISAHIYCRLFSAGIQVRVWQALYRQGWQVSSVIPQASLRRDNGEALPFLLNTLSDKHLRYAKRYSDVFANPIILYDWRPGRVLAGHETPASVLGIPLVSYELAVRALRISPMSWSTLKGL